MNCPHCYQPLIEIDRYGEPADDCKQLAELALNETSRKEFADMAEAWLQLAVKIEADQMLVDELDAIARQEMDNKR